MVASGKTDPISVALLTGGSDKPYVLGLANELISKRVTLDLIGSDELDCPELRGKPFLNFLNLRGDQNPDVGFARKVHRVCAYYVKLFRYASSERSRIFHILWNNKRFEFFDRTLLILYYKLLGKRIVITTHNVNERKRDGSDTRLNRLTLRIQYRLADHIFVHTENMKVELVKEFGVPQARITVIPFGINNAVPNTTLTAAESKRRLGIRDKERTILFFGRITPYKGLEYLVTAFKQIANHGGNYRLIIAGKPEAGCGEYLRAIREASREYEQSERILFRSQFIPDDDTEVYFKAADVLVLPYRAVYQSGVLFLAYSFGLPVLAADVGSLKDDIVEGQTGFVFKPEDPNELAKIIEQYFASELYTDLSRRRPAIRAYATQRHSWDVVGQETVNVYARLLQTHPSGIFLNRKTSSDTST